MYYLIKDRLYECDKNDCKQVPFVCVFTTDEWLKQKDFFDFGNDVDENVYEIYATKAEVNTECLAGSFSIPYRKDLNNDDQVFSFFLNEECVVFVDDTNYVNEAISQIIKTKQWRLPSLERFMYDFLDYIIKDDLRIMEKYEIELEQMEDNVGENEEPDSQRLNSIRSEIRRFNIHYEQLLDVATELDENENNYFSNENLKYFRSYISRLERLLNTTSSIRDYVMQIEDMHKEQINIKQNHIMTLLTVVTTIFMPLTLITGWYGMNFEYMPELDNPLAYPLLIIVCILIAVAMLYYFRKKKWL